MIATTKPGGWASSTITAMPVAKASAAKKATRLIT
jgi:hypothetical protein